MATAINSRPPMSGTDAPDAVRPPHARWRILWADDDPAFRRLVAMVLMRDGHDVTMVSDGFEAIQLLTARPGEFDVLMTDHDMPHITGLELVRELRHQQFPVRIVVVSGSLDDALAASYRALAVEGLLEKPFSPTQLLAALSALSRAAR